MQSAIFLAGILNTKLNIKRIHTSHLHKSAKTFIFLKNCYVYNTFGTLSKTALLLSREDMFELPKIFFLFNSMLRLTSKVPYFLKGTS